MRIHPKELHIETFEDAMGAKPQPFSRGVTGEAKKKFLCCQCVREEAQ